MPGGWTMSMAWIRMSGQTWPGAAAAFTGMWIVMMVAMMLPSLVSMLSRYRHSLRAEQTPLGVLTMLVGAGYFFVWVLLGLSIYPLGVIAGAAEMEWQTLARSVPLASGVVLLLAGCVQLTPWKARQLARCRDAPDCTPLPADGHSAWRHGLRLGVRCALCCASFMVTLLVTGVMNLAGMAMVAAAITFERLAPKPEGATRAAGVVVIAAGAVVIARALGVA